MNSIPVTPTGDWASIPKSRFVIWLFLSTEVMFFVALISSYLVMRFGVRPTDWPKAAAVGLVPWIGGVNTLILLTSSVFMTRAATACGKGQAGSAKIALVVALALGGVFLAIKSYEYWEKIHLGLYPRQQAALIYSQYDTEYLGAVQREIVRTRDRLEMTRKITPSPELEQKIAKLDEMKLGLIAWTNREVGQSDDAGQRDQAIRALAHCIRPTPQSANQVADYLREQRNLIEIQREQLAAGKLRTEQELADSVAKLQSLPANDYAQERTKLETLLAERRTDLTKINNDLSAIAERLKWLDSLATEESGINVEHGICLPIVLPGGRTWLNGYYLLTGMHAIHLLAGIIAGAVLLPMTLSLRRTVWLGNVATYWHFVDGVWLILFPIIYLL